MVQRVVYIIFVLILAHIATAFVFNDTLLQDHDNKLNGMKTRRKDQSTSSESKSVAKKEKDVSESLNVVFTETDSSSDSKMKKKKDRSPKETLERKGWRKWHRKCTQCPADIRKKWRDVSINWICGAYQRARRSFKSLCMMHFRNCQDGTMFTKIADHRCVNGSTDGVHPYNQHFFYDYEVMLTSEESDSEKESDPGSESDSTSVSETEVDKKLPPFIFDRTTPDPYAV